MKEVTLSAIISFNALLISLNLTKEGLGALLLKVFWHDGSTELRVRILTGYELKV